MTTKYGQLSISSENIFPIIKKWVYSDHDIFIREMISNGCDAITKLKKLDMMGEYSLPDNYKPRIDVIVNSEDKTIRFIDNGIGMTEAEVEEYITQIAFSGATKFLEKYKDKTTQDDMIGHFGLGFYSAFMVADEVEIQSLSWQKDAKSVHWSSEGGIEYSIEEGNKEGVGTEIILHLNEDSLAFSNVYKAREVLEKYCSFIPVEIYLTNANEKPEEPKEGEEPKKPEPINDIHPLWSKHQNECTEEDYKSFYRKVFLDYKEPLFWIHLNMDYPFNLKGILYFPRINTEYDSLEGTIKLYNNQVFIADNIKEVIPEYLLIMKGVIDCPDLPLNVSRSALQNDGFVGKIAEYISKKVAEKLSGMCKTKREDFEKCWDNIGPFVKFGCLKDDKFCEKMTDSILFKNLDHKYLTLKEYLGENKQDSTKDEAETEAESETDGATANKSESTGLEENVTETATTEGECSEDGGEVEDTSKDDEKEAPKTRVYYVSDERLQSQYINLFKSQGQDAVILNHNIDTHFITQLEQKNPDLEFLRIDADLTEGSKEYIGQEDKEDFEKTSKDLISIFKKELGKDKMEIKVEKLKDANVASVITLSEQSRRMQEMMKMYGMDGMDLGKEGEGCTLIINANHPLVQYVAQHRRSKSVSVICKQLFDLAMLSHKPLSPEEMTEFVKRSNEIMMLLTK
ncbi:MAG: molecular chaperone HtpG [Lachnospiraceae bacterium]|jgi:molecular chaperone HtpG|nr:molecular chaperone HtpG [Lachnospiraceae bacterium]